ncbi:putative unsaturated glucuronyl hydrolase [Lachnospiraceae bacterium KM106-2]|nr:putative unsaturated glucuronyl hydrolase [Lachnospiraceae bacterium KM106-2]
MNEKDKSWALSIAEQIDKKVKVTSERNQHKIPYTSEKGHFNDCSDQISWWTNGFYAGQLWQLYHAYGEESFKREAEEIEKKLDQNLMDYRGMDHDSGFKWMLTAVADYKITGDERSKNRGMLAANNLAGRFNLSGGYLRAWNDAETGEQAGWAIIDCMMNLPLLYWAFEVTRDPRFTQIAKAHADTVIQNFIREDGSVDHIVTFDPATGEKKQALGGQGLAVGSSWTRGQAWALYGFTLSYIHTKEERYLQTAKRTAEYIIKMIPETGILPVDFKQGKECEWEDSSAAAIIACGLLELERYVGENDQKRYHDQAVCLLHTLTDKRCNWDNGIDPIVENCSAAYHDKDHNMTLIYADYYFTEAILKLCGKEIFLW